MKYLLLLIFLCFNLFASGATREKAIFDRNIDYLLEDEWRFAGILSLDPGLGIVGEFGASKHMVVGYPDYAILGKLGGIAYFDSVSEIDDALIKTTHYGLGFVKYFGQPSRKLIREYADNIYNESNGDLTIGEFNYLLFKSHGELVKKLFPFVSVGLDYYESYPTIKVKGIQPNFGAGLEYFFGDTYEANKYDNSIKVEVGFPYLIRIGIGFYY